ncbi:MFS transporter [Corynebacterium diphtheriae]|uniref:uridine transporter UriT n=1 Tax=Corynebacterium diphtheriae TaxID=1717 RepID=UPI0008FBAFFA|nr:MFS transporter [Corynebacterium diphtheriae]OIR70347.1 multidrug ABC transporter [Corynebacterium diphtheriae]OIR74822.1 multidrug ABC transporter [Corynebacterium diphtheriae]OIR80622.1 multidrug ABC transporter [Corynebacterium diphtheriae]OIR97932.1 multidrug ABC transporter [Corynebacterium diphtheriae]OIS01987.1 multidrug ABC transporter [Corynebacterium diphtheriae]
MKVRTVPLMLALLAAVFAFQLNASMLSPALATMEKELNATSAQIGLTQTAFFTAAALFSLFLPRWGDLIGRRKVLVGMMALTAIGCVVAALAPNVTVLFIGRVIQGVAGPTVPLCLIMLRQQIPDEKQYALLLGILTSVNGGIGGVDALLGGWLAGSFGFRSIFWVMAAVCVVAVIVAQLFTTESTAEETAPMDWAGVAPLAVAIGALLIAFNEAGKLGDAHWLLVAVLAIVGVAGVMIFWKVEQKVAHPLVTINYLAQRRTWALLLTTLLTMTGVFAVMNGLIPNIAQAAEGPGLAADVVSWWTLTPYALAGLFFGPIAGTLAARWGYTLVLRIGLVGTLFGLIATAVLSNALTPALLLVISLFVGVTYAGIANIMLNGLGIVLSPADNQGYLPGMNAGAFNLGAGLSFAVLFAVTTATGYQIGIVTGAVIVACALGTSLLIPKPETISDTLAAVTATETAQGRSL